MSDDELGRKAIERKQADLDGLAARNAQRLQALAAQGVEINLVGALVGELVDRLFPEGTAERIEFLRGWEERVAGFLDTSEAEVRRRVLLAGVHQNGAASAS